MKQIKISSQDDLTNFFENLKKIMSIKEAVISMKGGDILVDLPEEDDDKLFSVVMHVALAIHAEGRNEFVNSFLTMEDYKMATKDFGKKAVFDEAIKVMHSMNPSFDDIGVMIIANEIWSVIQENNGKLNLDGLIRFRLKKEYAGMIEQCIAKAIINLTDKEMFKLMAEDLKLEENAKNKSLRISYDEDKKQYIMLLNDEERIEGLYEILSGIDRAVADKTGEETSWDEAIIAACIMKLSPKEIVIDFKVKKPEFKEVLKRVFKDRVRFTQE